MSSGLRSQASNEGQGGGQNPLALQADFSQGIATAVQEQVSRAVSDVSTKLSAGLDKRIEQLDQRAEKRDAERWLAIRPTPHGGKLHNLRTILFTHGAICILLQSFHAACEADLDPFTSTDQGEGLGHDSSDRF